MDLTDVHVRVGFSAVLDSCLSIVHREFMHKSLGRIRIECYFFVSAGMRTCVPRVVYFCFHRDLKSTFRLSTTEVEK